MLELSYDVIVICHYFAVTMVNLANSGATKFDVTMWSVFFK